MYKSARCGKVSKIHVRILLPLSLPSQGMDRSEKSQDVKRDITYKQGKVLIMVD